MPNPSQKRCLGRLLKKAKATGSNPVRGSTRSCGRLHTSLAMQALQAQQVFYLTSSNDYDFLERLLRKYARITKTTRGMPRKLLTAKAVRKALVGGGKVELQRVVFDMVRY